MTEVDTIKVKLKVMRIYYVGLRCSLALQHHDTRSSAVADRACGGRSVSLKILLRLFSNNGLPLKSGLAVY